MSSSVFFRFKSQKEPTRVAFDGMGISVFELKREIIAISRLGDGTDFELLISSEDTNEEYNDDTSIIPRSTTVIAKRLPAAKAGRGGAARYVSGKIPQNPKNSHRSEEGTSNVNLQGKGSNKSNGLSDMSQAQTEEQKIAAMFKMGADQWAQQQEEMANAIPIHRAGHAKGKPANAPDRPPPPGYVCYRCGEKGHWIQVCPTNDDPNFDGRPRIKRTTGIPRSFLKAIDKPASLASDGALDESKQPAGIMVNADGEWVIAEPDQASWDQYQAKTKVSAAAQQAAAMSNQDLRRRGLECSIDKRLFVEPTKTPCCQTTYCHDCITNALLENDLRCPQCSAKNILIDNLLPDDQAAAKIQSYEDEQAKLRSKSENPEGDAKEGSVSATNAPKDPTPYAGLAKSNGKKRPAETDLKSERSPPGPISGNAITPNSHQRSHIPSTMPLPYQVPLMNNDFLMPQAINSVSFPSNDSFMGLPMNMGLSMSMDPAVLNAMMMQGGPTMGGSNNGWNHPWGTAVPQPPTGSVGGANLMSAQGYPQGILNYANGVGYMSNGLSDPGLKPYDNHERPSFAAPILNEEDSAYFRKPINPHRHQSRRNVPRPTDYHEI